MFAEIDTLPGTECKFTIANRNQHRTSQQGSFQVRRHIIRSFIVMNIIRIIFLDGFIEEHFKVLSDCGVSVFVDGEGCGCVLDEDLAKAGGDFVIRDGFKDVGSDEVEAAGE